MSQTCKPKAVVRYALKNPIECIRFTNDMVLTDLFDFVGEAGTVCFNSGGVSIAFGGPYCAEDAVELEEDDMIVRLAGEIEVYSPEGFEEQFDAVS